jgi:O-antigen/teichoic acid export membrane protein
VGADPVPLSEKRIRRFFDADFRQVVRNSSWSVATTALTVGLFFAETTILARHFGPKTFGVYLLVLAYPEAVQLFLDFRTREAMTRYLGGFLAREEHPEAVAVVKLLWLVDLGVVCSAYALVFVTAPLVAPHLTHDPGSSHLMRIYGIAMLLGGLDATAGVILRVFDRFRLSFLTGGGAMVVRLSIIVAVVSTGSGIGGVIWARVASEALTTLVVGTAAFVLLKQALWRYRRTAVRRLSGRLSEISRFLLHTNFQGSLRAAAGKLDVIAVGAIGGPATASFYKLGLQFGSSPLLFSDPLFSAVYPQFARAHALENDRQIRRIGLRVSIVLAAVAIPTATVLALTSKLLLTGIVGKAFAAAWVPFVIALAGVVPSVVFFWGRPAMLSLGEPRVASRIAVASIIVQFVVLLALIHPFGAGGAAAGFAAMNLIGVALTIRYLRRRKLL